MALAHFQETIFNCRLACLSVIHIYFHGKLFTQTLSVTSSQFKGCKAAHLEAVFTVSAAGPTCDTSCGLAAGSLGLGIKFPGCLGHCQGGGRGSLGSDLFRDLQTFSKSAGWRSAVSSATLEILCGTERETAGPGRRAALPGPGPWRYDVGGPRSVDTGGGA